MIVSIHLAQLGPLHALGTLRRPPRSERTPGLIWGTTVVAGPMGPSLLPGPRPGWLGLIAGWQSDEACERFAASDPLAATFRDGWEVRTEPLRVFGAWAPFPDLPRQPLPADGEEPLAALTIGRLHPYRALPFLRAAAGAEAAAVDDPDQLLALGFGRPPRLVSTFSVWRSAAAMREYAFSSSGAHQAAVRADRERGFHRESAFIRLRPYASRGQWQGRDPLRRADEVRREGTRAC